MGSEWVSRARRALEDAGMTVSEGVVRYHTLTGESVSEMRVTGWSSDRSIKVTLSSRESAESVRISVVAQGGASTRRLAEALEEAGASVDFEEGERLQAVLKKVSSSDVEEVLRGILRP